MKKLIDKAFKKFSRKDKDTDEDPSPSTTKVEDGDTEIGWLNALKSSTEDESKNVAAKGFLFDRPSDSALSIRIDPVYKASSEGHPDGVGETSSPENKKIYQDIEQESLRKLRQENLSNVAQQKSRDGEKDGSVRSKDKGKSIFGAETLEAAEEEKGNQRIPNVAGNFVSQAAWEKLKEALVEMTAGTTIGSTPSQFFVSGLACLMKNPPDRDTVKNFLLRVNLGSSAPGTLIPLDSIFYWLILLVCYTNISSDNTFVKSPQVKNRMELVLSQFVSDSLDTSPSVLCSPSPVCNIIDYKTYMNSYPVELQALFFFALRCARQMMKQACYGQELIGCIDQRIAALRSHIQNYFWLDFTQINNISYGTHIGMNELHIPHDCVPEWLFDFMTERGGYLMGNVGPGQVDFRWFLVGNCIAILSSLVTQTQATAIMNLIEERWEQLVGKMPLKIVYPAVEKHLKTIVKGLDPKNVPWNCYNGGSWPGLLWLLTAAAIKTGRPQIANRAVELVEQRLYKDDWPEYYSGRTGNYLGYQARKSDTNTIAGYLVAKMMIEDPSLLYCILSARVQYTNEKHCELEGKYQKYVEEVRKTEEARKEFAKGYVEMVKPLQKNRRT